MLGLGLRERVERSQVARLYRLAVSPEFRFVRATAEAAFAKIPPAEFEAIRRKYLVEDPAEEGARIVHTSSRKYLDAREWLENAVQRAMAVKLHERSPISVLDLGCGAGYFLHVARHFGHRVMGLDLGENRMYNELIALMKIDRIAHTIDPLVPLPEFGRTFDLVTGYMVYFNFYDFGIRQAKAWAPREWGFFLNDVRKILNPGGHLRLELNKGGPYLRPHERFVYLTDETTEFLRSQPGVRVPEDRRIVTLDV